MQTRYDGQIIEWNDQRGFGFVAPKGGGERAFVHISQFRQGSRRPINGDRITYSLATDRLGRFQAHLIRYEGERHRSIGNHASISRIAIGCGALVLVFAAAVLKWIPALIAGCYFGFSVLSYLMYMIDKDAARKREWRISEGHLHLVDTLGGWPGALIAQEQFRHKTRKMSFQVVFWLSVIINLVGMSWLVLSKTAAEWDQLMSDWVMR